MDLYQTPDERDQVVEEYADIDEEVQDTIKGDTLALEEVQMLNDMARNGQVEASLSLFNLYLQGAEGMGIDRD